MSEKKNQLWRLDLLEAHFLQKPTRYHRTKSLLRVKGKNKTNLLPGSKDLALREIDALREDVFAKKLHSSLVKYNRAIKKSVKVLNKKSTKDDEKEFLSSLDIDLISTIRIIKLVSTIFKLNPRRDDAPAFVPSWIVDTVKDKSNPKNPSHWYNSMDATQRNVYSKLMNQKEIQQIVEIMENSFKMILGPVEKESKRDIEDVETSESESEDAGDETQYLSAEEFEGELGSGDEGEISDYEQFTQYDNMIAGSDDEDDEAQLQLDNTINYNEVTDEEPSDLSDEESEKDDFFVEEINRKETKDGKKDKKSKDDKKKSNDKLRLPELQYGYLSASDGEDVEDDVVQSITEPKKNRRGQRARQKIWEQKYGKGAKHVIKEKEKVRLEREQKQKEYEERVAKRAAKADMTGSNNTPLGDRKSGEQAPPQEKKEELHPSWIAKKKQEEALKNVKFSGKKTVF